MTVEPIKIWVTGATGLLGRAILRHLPPDSATVALARNIAPISSLLTVRPYACDIAQFGNLKTLAQTMPPQWIIHSAALTNVDQCEDDPELAMRINADGTRNLAQIASEYNSRLIYISTDSVFDGAKGHYIETDPANPINIYAKTKRRGEQAALETHANALALRTNFFGPGGIGKIDLATWFINQLLTGKPVNGFEDVFFSPILSDKLAALIFELAATDITGVLHLAGCTRLSKHEFGQHIARRMGIPEDRVCPARLTDLNAKAARPLDTSLNCAKAEEHLGRSMPNIDENLTSFFELVEIKRPGI